VKRIVYWLLAALIVIPLTVLAFLLFIWPYVASLLKLICPSCFAD
jgi:hypothetical protein